MVVGVAVTVSMVMSVAGFAAFDRAIFTRGIFSKAFFIGAFSIRAIFIRAIFIRTIFIRTMHHLSIAKGCRVRNLPASHY